MEIIARIHTDFPEKFGIPRQSGLVEGLTGRVVFEPKYRNPDAVRGLESFSHIWLIWQFSENERGRLVGHGKAAQVGGKQADGRFRHTLSFSGQTALAFPVCVF